MCAAMLLALTPLLVLKLPSTPPKTGLAYRSLIRSLVQLVRAHADLRRVAATQFLLGICYGGFWATLAPMLLVFHRLGPAQVGLMAIPGSAGIFAARPAGRWTDRSGVLPVVTLGVGLVLGAYVAFALAPWWVAAVVAGAVLLDCGLRAAMVANQTLVNSLVPEARSRSNTIFAAHVWGGNAAGAFLGSTALTHSGWPAVCAIGALAAAADQPMVVMYGDIVVHGEALRGLIVDPRTSSAILAGGKRRRIAFRVQARRGKMVSAASAYHAVGKANGTFLGVLRTTPGELETLPVAAARLAALVDGPPESWEEELERKAQAWRLTLARTSGAGDDGEDEGASGDDHTGPDDAD